MTRLTLNSLDLMQEATALAWGELLGPQSADVDILPKDDHLGSKIVKPEHRALAWPKQLRFAPTLFHPEKLRLMDGTERAAGSSRVSTAKSAEIFRLSDTESLFDFFQTHATEVAQDFWVGIEDLGGSSKTVVQRVREGASVPGQYDFKVRVFRYLDEVVCQVFFWDADYSKSNGANHWAPFYPGNWPRADEISPKQNISFGDIGITTLHRALSLALADARFLVIDKGFPKASELYLTRVMEIFETYRGLLQEPRFFELMKLDMGSPFANLNLSGGGKESLNDMAKRVHEMTGLKEFYANFRPDGRIDATTFLNPKQAEKGHHVRIIAVSPPVFYAYVFDVKRNQWTLLTDQDHEGPQEREALERLFIYESSSEGEVVFFHGVAAQRHLESLRELSRFATMHLRQQALKKELAVIEAGNGAPHMVIANMVDAIVKFALNSTEIFPDGSVEIGLAQAVYNYGQKRFWRRAKDLENIDSDLSRSLAPYGGIYLSYAMQIALYCELARILETAFINVELSGMGRGPMSRRLGYVLAVLKNEKVDPVDDSFWVLMMAFARSYFSGKAQPQQQDVAILYAAVTEAFLERKASDFS